jgi:hypothetical protein
MTDQALAKHACSYLLVFSTACKLGCTKNRVCQTLGLRLGDDFVVVSVSCFLSQEVRRKLQSGAASVKAELYKLNIMRLGDFFKSHVDTPRGPDRFGSLVICLPHEFTGVTCYARL